MYVYETYLKYCRKIEHSTPFKIILQSQVNGMQSELCTDPAICRSTLAGQNRRHRTLYQHEKSGTMKDGQDTSAVACVAPIDRKWRDETMNINQQKKKNNSCIYCEPLGINKRENSTRGTPIPVSPSSDKRAEFKFN